MTYDLCFMSNNVWERGKMSIPLNSMAEGGSDEDDYFGEYIM